MTISLVCFTVLNKLVSLVPSHPADGFDGSYPDVGRSPSFLDGKAQKEIIARDFDASLDFKDNSGHWTSSQEASLSASASGSGSGSGSGPGTSSGSGSNDSSEQKSRLQ